MRPLQESIIGRKGSYQKMKISDLKPGDVLKIKSDYDGSREYDYLLLISGDDYYKLFKQNYADLVIIVDPYSGRITPGEIWDDQFKNKHTPYYLERGDIIEIYPQVLNEKERRSKKFYSAKELERICWGLPSIKVN